MRRIHFILIAVIGIVPILWYRPAYIIAKADHLPLFLNPGVQGDLFYLWSTDNVGNPTPVSAYSLFGALWIGWSFFSHDIGLFQIMLQVVYFAGAMFSMCYLTETIYPEEKDASILAGIFYVFNLPLLLTVLNLGMMWMYAFFPLLAALLVRILRQREPSLKLMLFFALAFTVIGSISSINIANIALIGMGLMSIAIYKILFSTTKRRAIMKKLILTMTLTTLLSLWWIVPNLNYYVVSSTTMQFQQEMNIRSWGWTHARSSLTNLFWLNGGWGWRAEYVPFYEFYSGNLILMVLLLLPFSLASIALYFEEKKLRLNSCILLFVLGCLFLAKGLHEPLGYLNILLYDHVPYMNMFREPATKFTLIILPFLALLIGYAIHRVTENLEKRAEILKKKYGPSLVIRFGLCVVLLIAVFPIFLNPIETETEEIPYSTYVKIPQYWFDAGEWLNSETEEFTILLTPLVDYYQVPYIWGYYGADILMEKLVDKPVINRVYAYNYKVNPEVALLIDELYLSIACNESSTFQTLLNLLKVKYLVQRNDLDHEYLRSSGRELTDPETIKSFFLNQSCIRLAKTFGALDIYQFNNSQSGIHILSLEQLARTRIEKEVNSTMHEWDFESATDVYEWKRETPVSQFNTTVTVSWDNMTLKFELLNSTWGWKSINSPIISSTPGTRFDLSFDIKCENAHEVHLKVVEYDSKMEIVEVDYLVYVGGGSFDWKHVEHDYNPRFDSKFLQLQIWNGHETRESLPNKVWIDNVEIFSQTTRANITEIQQIMTPLEIQPAEVIKYERLSPTKIIFEVNAQEPFVLAMSEGFDANWRAYVDGEAHRSIPILSIIDGFEIHKTGLIEIVVEYEPQRWFTVAAWVSALVLISCLVYIVTSRLRPQKSKEKGCTPKSSRNNH